MECGIVIVSDDKDSLEQGKKWHQMSNTAFQKITGLDLEDDPDLAYTERIFKLSQQSVTQSFQSMDILTSQSDMNQPYHTQQDLMTLRELLLSVCQNEMSKQVMLVVRQSIKSDNRGYEPSHKPYNTIRVSVYWQPLIWNGQQCKALIFTDISQFHKLAKLELQTEQMNTL